MTLRKHSVDIMGMKTSVTVEDEFWNVLSSIAVRKSVSINSLVADIDLSRDVASPNLSSGIRVYVLEYVRQLAGI